MRSRRARGLAVAAMIAGLALPTPEGSAGTPLVFTIAGNESRYDRRDGSNAQAGSASDLAAFPTHVAATADGGYVFIDGLGDLWRGDAFGRLVRLGRLPPAGLAPGATGWWTESDIAAPRDGSVLVAVQGGVLRRGGDGRWSTFAGRPGSDAWGSGGDGGVAVGAGMRPSGLAAEADGGLLIADQDQFRVRRVDATGRITTVAGDGASATGADGAPATQTPMTPAAVSARPDGSFVVLDNAGRTARVRLVGSDGRVRTLAGGGARRLGRGGCPARPVAASQARLPAGLQLAALPDGGVLLVVELGDEDDATDGSALLAVSPAGSLSALVCGGAEFLPIGRALAIREDLGSYSDARTADADRWADPISDVTVDAGGSPLVALGHLAMLAAVGRTPRLAIALPVENLRTSHSGRIAVVLTRAAHVRFTYRRAGRLVGRGAADLPAGRSLIRTGRPPGGGLVEIEVRAHTGQGQTAGDRQYALTGPVLPLGLARRRLIASVVSGDGGADPRIGACRRRSLRRIRCTATFPDGTPPEQLEAFLRRDGTLAARGRSASQRRFSRAYLIEL